MNYSKKIILLLTATLMLNACVTTKKLTYLQSEAAAPQAGEITSVTPAAYRVLPYDNLFIRVVTPDPKVSEMFNTLPVTTYSINMTEQTADVVSYPVDGNGDIILPYIGRVSVAGKTLGEITVEVEKELKEMVKDPAVTVKMVNNYVSLLGEVKNPGKYPVYKDRLTIFQALAMANDLTDFSNRQKIQLIRPTASGNIIKEFSLNDILIMSSEAYYVMPNDVIYVKPMKGRIFRLNEFPYSLMLSTVTTFVLILNVVK
ncbi:MAG TPA: polysaccharide biosynthesis/export family protein [Bacteroidales bacterium]|nr:polysaccharide biosynthesis/export family protein [Bacteroidales bacterium]